MPCNFIKKKAAAVPPSGTVEIGTDTKGDLKAPWYGLYNYSVEYFVFLQSEIGSGSKTIDSIEIKLASYTLPYTMNTQRVKLAHTTNSNIPASTKTDLTGMSYTDLTTCFSGTINIANGWNTITFSTPFTYNGTNNLLIVFENEDGSWANGYGTMRGNDISEFRWFYFYRDASYPTSEFGTRDDTLRPTIRLNYS